MPIVKVLVNQKGEVIGTARTEVKPTGTDAPERATIVARPGQRVVEVNIDEKEVNLDPAKLHATLKAKHIRPPK